MKTVYIAGHTGMVGSALRRQLEAQPNTRLLLADRTNLNLLCQQSVNDFFANNDIDEVYLAAAKVGGIQANSELPADFIYENLVISANVIRAAHQHGVNKLLYLGSSCIYPRITRQPITENQLLTGKLEPTNEPYAIAKIAGIKLCESFNRQYETDYRAVMPCNLYGPNDNFHPHHSHVIPALIRRFHEARLQNSSCVSVWGSGTPLREFLHVDDMAAGAIHVMNVDQKTYSSITEPMQYHINIGSGVDCSIAELATLISGTVGFKGSIEWDTSKPDGAPQKRMDISKISKLGWSPRHELKDGLGQTYQWFLDQTRF